nr:MAG TPA_asm: hypothetical protein [Caudoviricetes sp.]
MFRKKRKNIWKSSKNEFGLEIRKHIFIIA